MRVSERPEGLLSPPLLVCPTSLLVEHLTSVVGHQLLPLVQSTQGREDCKNQSS